MNTEIKAKWVAALRSGKYKQGTELLRNGINEFCCLGVLCDLYDSNLWDERCKFLSSKCTVPSRVIEWSGLKSDTGDMVEIGGTRFYLTEHNDRGRTFAEIADAIEEQL